ncbi:MAG: SDR family oxidoreductase [Acidobacteriaceae bacterium]|nr:SDR family oxidoreductase [Acidobacteriaceae bacterium]
MLLANKTAIVTGSANGIGEAVAHLFSTHGARLLLLDRDEARNAAVASAIAVERGRAIPIALDLRNRPAIDAAVEKGVDEFGAIDILINNAGIYPRQDFMSMTEQQWDEMQDINLKSMFHLTQAVLPGMLSRGAGKIVNISSVTFHLGMASLAHYIASKGGVIGLTRALARELGPHNVYVNCVTPGAILVEAEKAVVTDEQVRAWVDQQSLKRRILPLDIARVCLFLSCELSDGMTGQTLNVDGGWVMY